MSWSRMFRLFWIVLFVFVTLSPLAAAPGLAQGTPPEGDGPHTTPKLTTEYIPDRLTSAAKTQQRTNSQPTANVMMPRLSWSKVAYESYTSGNGEIYIANDDGSGLRLLASSPSDDFRPNLNRGCTLVAFASDRTGNYDIYTIKPDNTGLTRLTTNIKDDANPAWSPDGTKIAFQSYRDGHAEVYVMNSDGTGQTRLTYDTVFNGLPSWSPDGTKIAYTSYHNQIWRIWVMGADGSNQTQLSTVAYSELPVWSPDGKQIAFDADYNGDEWQDLVIMNSDGSNQKMLLTHGSTRQAFMGAWSPDGARISYTLVSYIYDSSYEDWFWTDAYLYTLKVSSAYPEYLLGSYLDWNPNWQTLDNAKPDSTMQALPPGSATSFIVNWSGSDSGGSGLKTYDIQYKDGNTGTWLDLLPATTLTSTTFNGWSGHTYFFRARAIDNAYNLEAWPATFDAYTTVDAVAPVTTFTQLPLYSPVWFMVSWSGSDPGGSGIKSYEVQYRDGMAGTWLEWLPVITGTTAAFQGEHGHGYFFRIRAIDNANNQEAWPADYSAYTTIDAQAPVSAMTALPLYSPIWFQVNFGGSDATGSGIKSYDLQYRDGAAGSWVDWLPGMTGTSAAFVGQNGHTYFFRLRATDNTNNVEAWPADYDIVTTVDTQAPAAAVSALSRYNLESFNVSWGGSDGAGSGIKAYDIQVRDGAAGSWVDWRPAISSTSATFSGVDGHTYYFRARGIDNVNIVEAWPVDFDAYTTIDLQSPASVVYPLANYNLLQTTVKWNGADLGGAGIKHYDVQYKDLTTPGSWTDWQIATTQTSADFTQTAGITYAFRVRAVDAIGNIEAWPVDASGETSTTLYRFSLIGSVLDNSGSPILDAAVTTNPAAFTGGTSGADGAYRLYAAGSAAEVTANWSKTGYGSLPETPFVSPGDATVSVVLPPLDNVVLKPDFEFGDLVLTDWSVVGNLPSKLVPEMHTGSTAYRLGEPIGVNRATTTPANGARLAVTGSAVLSQTLTLPDTLSTPILSFFYMTGDFSEANAGQFDVQVTSADQTTDLFSASTNSPNWTHQWVDLSAWAGQEITLHFMLTLADETDPGFVLIDDVTVGSSVPDLWAAAAQVPNWTPGTPVQIAFTYGNQGAAPAPTTLTATLPAGLTYVSADLDPTLVDGQTLTWELGSLTGKSGPLVIHVSASVDQGVLPLSSLIGSLEIQTSASEVEMTNNTATLHVFLGNRFYMPLARR